MKKNNYKELFYMTQFNQKEVFDKEIAPKLEEIKKLCLLNNIPMFFTACVSNSNDTTEYESELISPDMLDAELKNNHFPRHINVMHGFATVPANEMIELKFGQDI
jgi:hypothetical protein